MLFSVKSRLMGHTISLLGTAKVNLKTIFSKRLSIEEAENFHIHYRNLRLELNKDNFITFTEGLSKSLKNYTENKGKKVPGQTFLSYSQNIKEKDIVNCDDLKIELCENLYKNNQGNIFGKGADFGTEDYYIHIHYHDLRLELPLNEFEILVKTLINSYVYREQLIKENYFSSLKNFFEVINNSDIEYTVIRNWDQILHNKLDKNHPDIDLLLSPRDISKFDFITHTVLTNLETYRVQRRILVKINNKIQSVYIDVRSVTDNYFPESLSSQTLSSKRREGFVFTPAPKYQFLTLLYHMHFHKANLSEDYLKFLNKVFDPDWFDFNINKIKDIEYVRDFLDNLGYPVVEPYDASVYFKAI